MNLYYLFSKNKQLGSRLISWASGLLISELEVVPSHMAILVESKNWPDSFVLESTFNSGVRIVPYKNWLEINEECYKIPSHKKVDESVFFDQVHSYWGKKYDWPGIAYFAMRFIAHLLFRIPFPKDNSWQSDDKYFCNELGGEIAGYTKYSMVTPAKMCVDFLKINQEYNQAHLPKSYQPDCF